MARLSDEHLADFAAMPGKLRSRVRGKEGQGIPFDVEIKVKLAADAIEWLFADHADLSAEAATLRAEVDRLRDAARKLMNACVSARDWLEGQGYAIKEAGLETPAHAIVSAYSQLSSALAATQDVVPNAWTADEFMRECPVITDPATLEALEDL